MKWFHSNCCDDNHVLMELATHSENEIQRSNLKLFATNQMQMCRQHIGRIVLYNWNIWRQLYIGNFGSWALDCEIKFHQLHVLNRTEMDVKVTNTRHGMITTTCKMLVSTAKCSGYRIALILSHTQYDAS